MTRQEAIKKWNLQNYAIAYTNLDGVGINELVNKGLIDKHGTQVHHLWVHCDCPYVVIAMNTTAKTEDDY